ncbi:hypothetical protein HK098_006085, partial [Nowakowskiella sp. JEL0407]
MTEEQHEDVIHEPHHNPKRLIGIAIDESAHSEFAFNWALKNVIDVDHDQVILLNVRPIPTLPVFPIGGLMHPLLHSSPIGTTPTEWLARLEDEAKTQSHNLLKRFGMALLKQNVSCRAIALIGDPREEIPKKVAELKLDLLVLGSRGMGNLTRYDI